MSKNHLRLAAAFIGLSIAIPLIVLMFTGPSSHGKPHDLPIGVVGPQAAVAQVAAKAEQMQPGGFEVHGYATEDDLIAAAKDRDVYGGLVLGPRPRAVVATGASAAVTPIITGIAESAAQGRKVDVIDVAPPSADDPRGAGFGSMVLPVFMSGMALAMAAVLIGHHPHIVAAALPLGAALVGAAAIGVAMWVGVLPGGFWGQWLAMSAGMLAIGSVVAGLVHLIGYPGMGLAALVFMLVGMPLAGIAAPPEFLPHVWAAIGQFLPIGATGTALRSAAFFADGGLIGRGATTAFAVLIGWIVAGYALLAISVVTGRAGAGGAPSGERGASETAEATEAAATSAVPR